MTVIRTKKRIINVTDSYGFVIRELESRRFIKVQQVRSVFAKNEDGIEIIEEKTRSLVLNTRYIMEVFNDEEELKSL